MIHIIGMESFIILQNQFKMGLYPCGILMLILGKCFYLYWSTLLIPDPITLIGVILGKLFQVKDLFICMKL